MEIFVFKSNVRSRRLATQLLSSLQSGFPYAQFNFDLQDCDRVFRVVAPREDRTAIESFLTKKGVKLSELV